MRDRQPSRLLPRFTQTASAPLTYFLGVHQPAWLTKTAIPLFVSYARLRTYRTLPRAKGPWALDSGAFSELTSHGKWAISAAQYAETVSQIDAQVGNLQWASIQDWLCSPRAIGATGLSVEAHQRKTVKSLCDLRTLTQYINWIPVLQGWSKRSYLAHVQMYAAEGIDLRREPLVGVGSLASRQASKTLPEIIYALADLGLRIHAFGLSVTGLKKVHRQILSSDSMVWSYVARRRNVKLPSCKKSHEICNNCLHFAQAWRSNVLAQIRLT